MTSDKWDVLSAWLDAWNTADGGRREELRAELAVQHPDLLSEAEALAASSGSMRGFLETPALVLAAGEISQDEVLLRAGAMVGPYRVVDLIARGGMGDVYRATDERLGRDVALKVLAETKSTDPRRVERFTNEARITASLDHPNIVRVYDVGRLEDRAYLVAELLEGETLRSRIARGPMPVGDVVSIGLEVAAGLSAAHAAGLVHRDLKPDNIFLTRAGVTKILDFGIAKLAQDDTVRSGFSTLTGVVLGTAGYLAPEQIRGAAVDSRADLFTLGTVLFEMLTGARAFGREHMVETLHAILHDAPSNALLHDAPPALRDIVLRLLEKSPESRFESAAEVSAALRAVKPTDRSSPAAMRFRWLVRNARLRPRLTIAAALALAATVFAASWQALKAPTSTLALMPFATPGAAADPLGLGLADVLASRLGRLSDVNVLAAVDPGDLKRKGIETTDLAAVARRLSVTHVLTGTLRRDSGRVRATVQLFSAGTGRSVTFDPLDVAEENLAFLQDAIVARVMRELDSGSGTSVNVETAPQTRRNPQAWSAYLSGRAIVLRPVSEDLQNAAAFFEEAIRLEPGWADAWASLGSAYKRMPVVGGMEAMAAFPKARHVAETALRIDPNNVEAISVLGTVAFWHEWDYRKSEDLLRQALRLNQSHADSHLFLAHLLSNIGRADEALAAIRRARELDPQWAQARALEGQFLTLARRYDDAVKYLDRVVTDIDPGSWTAHLWHARALLGVGQYENALAACDRVVELRANPTPGANPIPLSIRAAILVRMNRHEEARAVLQRLPPASHYARASVLHALGRDDEAMAQLDRAIENRIVHVTFLGVDPQWDSLRDWPPFHARLQRVRLLEVSNQVSRRFRQRQ